MNTDRVIIIGNGIAGITAARHIRKNSNAEILVISSESEYFWSRTALMYIYMGHMKYEHTEPYERHFWKKNRIDLLQARVSQLHPDHKEIELENGDRLSYHALILATGSSPNMFGWPGQDLDGVSGMVSLQDLEYIEQHTSGIKRAVIVGGGLIGIELAEMLRSRNIEVTFLVREEYFWAGVLPAEEGQMLSDHIRKHHVDLQLSTELATIIGDENGRVKAVQTSSGKEIPCEFVGITAGVHANTSLVGATNIEVNKGILVNEYLETNIPDIYAIGDCAELRNEIPGRRKIEQVWYVGRMMGETVANTISGKRTTYKPGPWFNSAKFFDIEYQTYGNVAPVKREDEASFFWKADQKDIAVHIVFGKEDLRFKGINTFGIRMRHRMFDKWLATGTSVNTILSNLEWANFDPEFFKDYSEDIRNAFAAEYPHIEVEHLEKRKKILGLF